MGALRLSLPPLRESRNLHSALGRIFLPPRQADAALCQVHSRHQHHVSAARRQHEDAARRFPAIRCPRRGLYVGAYATVGYLFSDALRAITRGLRSAGFAAEVVLAIGLAAYVVYRIWIYRKYRLLDVIPRIQAEDLARRLASDAAQNMLVADVRSHGYYDADSERIAGSIRIEPNNLLEEIKNLPKEREIYLYCT